MPIISPYFASKIYNNTKNFNCVCMQNIVVNRTSSLMSIKMIHTNMYISTTVIFSSIILTLYVCMALMSKKVNSNDLKQKN